MTAIAPTIIQNFRPASDAAVAACDSFLEGVKAWSASYNEARDRLRSFVSSKTGASPLGIVSMDPLSMSSCAMVFDGDPGPGFLAVPDALNAKLAADGTPGLAYMPDVTTDLGRQVSVGLRALSKIAEVRPLLTGAPGVACAAVAGNNLVLTDVARVNGEYQIRALPAAVSAAAEVRPVTAPAAQPAGAQPPSSRPTPR